MQRKPRVSSVDIKKFVGICLLFLIFVASTMAIVRAQTYSFSAQWGSQGSADGQFNSPFDIAVGKSGNIYVADSGNNRIQKFDSNGNFLSTWGTTGSGNGQFRLGVLALKMGRKDQAIAALEKAIAIQPKSALAHAQLGMAYLQSGRLSDARREIEQAKALDPKDETVQIAVTKLENDR